MFNMKQSLNDDIKTNNYYSSNNSEGNLVVVNFMQGFKVNDFIMDLHDINY